MAKTHIETLIEKYSRDDEFIVDSLLIEISAQIADAMQGEGLSQSQLAERLGITKSYVSRLLHGTKNMTIRTLCRIANALDRSVSVQLIEFSVQKGSGAGVVLGGAQTVERTSRGGGGQLQLVA